jgi:hypothetical protein
MMTLTEPIGKGKHSERSGVKCRHTSVYTAGVFLKILFRTN